MIQTLLYCLSAVANSQTHVLKNDSIRNEVHIETQLGPIGGSLLAGLAQDQEETYFLKGKFEASLQGAIAYFGGGYRANFDELNYYEYGLGSYRSGTDSSLSDSKGIYISISFGKTTSLSVGQLKFGIEWTTISLLIDSQNSDVVPVLSLPKVTLSTFF